jgi:hypothetical protein
MSVGITRDRRKVGIELIVLEAEITCELAILATIQERYDYFGAMLQGRADCKRDRAITAEQLAVRLRKERQPHILRLADLHERMMVSTLYSGVEFNSETRH